jgi:O-antigen/teichoic acid export membrane protein
MFLLTPLGQQFQILFQKALRFRLLAGIQVTEHFIRGVASICLAFGGFGVISLVIGHLAGTVVRVLLLFLSSWGKGLPQLHFLRKDLEGYLSFGFYQMGDKTANFLNSYVIQLIIGSLLGAKALGYYVLAFNLVLRPTLVINPVLTRVAFPVFSKIQKDSLKVKRGYLEMLRILSFINFPIALGVGATAPIAVPLIYGDQWYPSVILIQILSIVAMLRSTGNPVGSLLLSHGRADLSFKWNLGKIFLQIPFVFAGATYGGVVGAVIAYLLLQSIYFFLNYFFLVTAVLDTHFKEYIQNVWSPLWISLVMVVGIIFLGRSFPENFSQSLSLMSEIICGAAVYTAIVLQYEKKFVLEIKNMVWGNT